jgi:hypothetical protein
MGDYWGEESMGSGTGEREGEGENMVEVHSCMYEKVTMRPI